MALINLALIQNQKMRNNIDRLKQLLEKTKEYKERFYKDRDSYFYSKEAGDLREDLTKRYEELKSLVVEANDGYIPSASMFGYDGIDIFANVYSEFNSTTAFHCLKLAPQYLIKAIAYHGGKKVTNTIHNSTKYVDPGIIDKFKSKQGKFDYKKLTTLLEELNQNYSENRPYATLSLIRAVLDHIPPLFGTNDFAIVASNYKWGKTDKKYMKQLLDFKAIADDVLHRQISSRQDLVGMGDIPKPILLNTLLQECSDNNEQAKLTPKNVATKQATSKIKITLSKNEISWDNYAEYKGPSFLLTLHIDNYESVVPDFITSAELCANSNDGQ